MNAIPIYLTPISHAKITLSLKFSVSLLLTTELDPLSCLKAQFSSVQLLSHVTLYDSMHCSTPGFSVHHRLPELAQTHVHRVRDAIQPSYPLLSPSHPAFNLS